MQVHDESLFLRAWGNLMRLAVALLLSGSILAYFAFVHFTAEVLQEGPVRLALRIASGILPYCGLKAGLFHRALSKSISA